MTAASGCASGGLGAEGTEVDAVVANGCGGGGSSAAGRVLSWEVVVMGLVNGWV